MDNLLGGSKIRNQLKVGSLTWRLLNYGFVPTCNYIWLDKLKANVTDQYRGNKIETSAICPVVLDSNSVLLEKSLHNLNEIYPQILSETEMLRKKAKVDKLPQHGSTVNRLLAIDLALRICHVEIVIESGTQNGVSARFIDLIANLSGNEIEIHTFDVRDTANYNFSPSVHQHVLKKRSRKEFKRLTSSLCVEKRFLFFHDSDHSAENMSFEFSWNWHQLKCSVLVSDDIDSNGEFQKMIRGLDSKETVFIVDYDDGPRAGIILRRDSGELR